MNLERAEKIANAVLYEGYILYPYRPSSVKNRQRWTFGGVYPRAYSEAQRGNDAWTMQTECLVEGAAATRVDVCLRFLHVQNRIVGAVDPPLRDLPASGEPAYEPVPLLEAGDQVYQTLQEAVERAVVVPGLAPEALATQPHEQMFTFPAGREVEPLRESGGLITGVIVREQRTISGAIEVSATPLGAGLTRLTVRVENRTSWTAPAGDDPRAREDAVLQACVSTHTLLGVRDGAFVSLLEPPVAHAAAAAACRNVGTWPVLVGEEGQRDLLLSSPIILYDYPQIAPESPGDLFDGTEIDEILTLRILTLTDAEKQEVRRSDAHARALLERTERLPAEQMMKLHGTLRNIRPVEHQP